MKRKMALFLVLTVLATCFALPAFAEEPITLTLLTTEAGTDEQLAYYEGLIADFCAQHPNITIELIQGGNTSDIDTKLNAGVLTDTYPDMILVTLATLGSRASMGEWANLADYISGWEEADDMYDSVFNIGLYQGQNAALGVYPVPEIYMYRKDYFEQAGLDPEVYPTTWDELYEYAKKLVQYDEQGNVTRGGFDVPLVDANSTMFDAFIRQAGGQVVDATTGELTLDNQATLDALNFLKKFVDEKLTVSYLRGTDSDPVVGGASAMGLVYTNTVTAMLQEDPSLKDKIGFFGSVKGETTGSFCGYRIFAIAESSEYKDEAWEFYKFLMSPEQMMTRYEKFAQMPVRQSLEEQFIANNPLMHSAMVECAKIGLGRPAVSYISLLNTYERGIYEETMYGVKTPEQALKDGLQRLADELALLGI